MVNTGQPSEGCFKCRDRRVKCDATKPGCHRCERLGVPCPGYPQRSSEVAFRDETSRTRNRAARMYQNLRVREEHAKSSNASSESSSTSSKDLQIRPARISPVFSALTATGIPECFGQRFDIRDVSFYKSELMEGTVSAYLASWSRSSVAVIESNLRSANQLYPDCATCLKAAVETMALWSLSLSDKSNTYNVRRAATDAYGQTLKELSAAIKSHEEWEFEQILLAIEMISFFEILTAPDDLPSRLFYHWSGMCAMIRSKGTAMFRTEARRRLFLDCFLGVIMGRMVMPRPRPMALPLHATEELVKFPLTPQIPEYTALPLIHKNFILRTSAADTLDDESTMPTLEAVLELKSNAEDILQDLKDWLDALPLERRQENRGMGTLIVNMGRVHQIFAYDVITRCIGRLRDMGASNPELEEEVRLARFDVKDLVMSVQACLPYTFIDEDPAPGNYPTKGLSERMVEHLGYSFPLLVISMVSFLEPSHQKAIQNARQACARGSKIDKPLRVLPPNLMMVAPMEPLALA